MPGLDWLKRALAHPLARGVDLDQAAAATAIHAEIIRAKPFLRRLYEEWAGWIAQSLPPGDAPVLELGSGGGLLKERLPGVMASDIFFLPDLDLVLRGENLPLADNSLKAVVMMDALHHFAGAHKFFGEAQRCLVKGGLAVMVEPWVSPWSRLIYGRLHHEPLDPGQPGWDLPDRGAFAGANLALPWIIFGRDRARFEAGFPGLAIRQIRLEMPFSYLVSGGVSLRSLTPGWSYPLWRGLERGLAPWMKSWAMVALIVLEKR